MSTLWNKIQIKGESCMKSKISQSRRFLECDCASPDHLLVVDLLEEEDQDNDIKWIQLAEFGFLSNHRASWWKRIYYAFRYIFRKDGFLTHDSVCFSEINIEELEKLVGTIKKQSEKLKYAYTNIKERGDEII